MTTNEVLDTRLKDLADDLANQGWDLPSKMYALKGDPNDPLVELIGQLPGDPAESMLAGFDSGFRYPEDSFGMVMAVEGWRPLSVDELLEARPTLVEGVKKQYEQQKGEPIEESRVREAVESFHERFIAAFPPAALPPFLRWDVRNLYAVLRDGTTVSLIHSKDKDDHDFEHKTVAEEAREGSQAPSYMYLLMHNLRPETVEDPMKSVREYQALSALDFTFDV